MTLTSLQHIQINNQTAAREIVLHSDPQETYLDLFNFNINFNSIRIFINIVFIKMLQTKTAVNASGGNSHRLDMGCAIF